MSLLDQIYQVSEKRTTKQDTVAYYEQKFGKDGKNRLVADLSGTTDKKSRAWKSAMRNFQARNTEKKGQEKPTPKWRKIGENLPLKAPPCGYHVEGTVYVKYSGECVDRVVDMDIVGKDADAIALMSDAEMAQAVVNLYNEDNVDEKEGYGSCQEPELTVTAIECDE